MTTKELPDKVKGLRFSLRRNKTLNALASCFYLMAIFGCCSALHHIYSTGDLPALPLWAQKWLLILVVLEVFAYVATKAASCFVRSLTDFAAAADYD